MGGRRLAPVAPGQFATELDQWQHIEGGIQFRHRLHFDAGSSEKLVITVQEKLTALPTNGQQSGWQRQLEVSGVPAGATLLLRVAEPEQLPGKKIDVASRQIEFLQEGGVEIRLPADAGKLAADGWLQVAGSSDADQPVRLKLAYTSNVPVDRFPQQLPAVKPPKPVALSIVPGFDGVRLPLAADLMPTAMSWDPTGRLFLTSLKGRVWQAVDTDKDGLEDRISLFSDELAAPFGISAHANHVDVINKYALLRLFDDNRDGQADRVERLASGWGHTTDYHDWAIGLPRDKQGNYYVATACQQDDRSEAAAYLRGKVLKLIPREPTKRAPGQYRVETLTGGHRFPTGIARNRSGNYSSRTIRGITILSTS